MTDSLGGLAAPAAHRSADRPLRARAMDTIAFGGAIAGVLDISDAIVVTVIRGGQPARMLQGIASGLLGPAAFDGGTGTALLGLALHFVIAFGAATTYFLASRRLPFLLRRPWLSGAIFGLGVFFVMRYVVLPLSLVRTGPFPSWTSLFNQLAIHAVGVGLPIALMASRSARRASVSGREAIAG